MNLKELTDLITIRNYVINATSIRYIDQTMSHNLDKMLIMLDKKIIGMITDPAFQEYINFSDVTQEVAKAAQLTNICLLPKK